MTTKNIIALSDEELEVLSTTYQDFWRTNPEATTNDFLRYIKADTRTETCETCATRFMRPAGQGWMKLCGTCWRNSNAGKPRKCPILDDNE